MSILHRTFVATVDESDARREGMGTQVAAVVAALSGIAALLTGVLGIITLSH